MASTPAPRPMSGFSLDWGKLLVVSSVVNPTSVRLPTEAQTNTRPDTA
jgi:hypothetical protein